MEIAPEERTAPSALAPPPSSPAAPPAPATPPAPPAWAALKDEELLGVRICDLGVGIEGSELEPRLRQFHEDLALRGVALRPDCYLGDEWFSPEGACAIAIPFYLAHPRLKALELRLMLEVEGGTAEWCQMLLRHECGHAIDHAYKFSARPAWQSIFGSPETEYTPETYTPRPYSRSFVRHLPNWYAQAHPDEDFAETFAVWLSSAPGRLAPALPRLEGSRKTGIRRDADAGGRLLQAAQSSADGASPTPASCAPRSHATTRPAANSTPKIFRISTTPICAPSSATSNPAAKPPKETAARFMRQHRAALIASIVQWTGQRKYTVNMLVQKLIHRCQQLKLKTHAEPARLHFDIASYLAAMVTNHLYTGRFKRSV